MAAVALGWIWSLLSLGATELTVYMEKSGKKPRKGPGPLAFPKSMRPSYSVM